MQSAQKSCSKQSSRAGSLSIVSSTLMGGVDIEKLCFSKVVETNLYQGPLEICCIT